jgi:hypothetical protein
MFVRCLTVFLLGWSIADKPQMPPQRGSICGYVQDENAQPAADTLLIAMYVGAHSGPMPAVKTDSQGNYCVQNLSLGEYQISAHDEDKGYPDLSGLFFAKYAPERIVSLSPAAPNGHVDVHIPYKAAFLSLLVIDSETGKPLIRASAKLAVRTDPDHRWMSTGMKPDRSILIPPNEDVILNVTSPGYGTWPDDGSKGMLVNLLSGDRQTIKVLLRKVP